MGSEEENILYIFLTYCTMRLCMSISIKHIMQNDFEAKFYFACKDKNKKRKEKKTFRLSTLQNE